MQGTRNASVQIMVAENTERNRIQISKVFVCTEGHWDALQSYNQGA